MNEHLEVKELLPLAASGALDASERRRVLQHLAECARCAAEERQWGSLASALAGAPRSQAPAGLAERTRARMLAALDERTERRWNNAVLAGLLLFGWSMGLPALALLRLVRGDLPAALDIDAAGLLAWLAASTVFAWITAGVAVLLIGNRRETVWRNL